MKYLLYCAFMTGVLLCCLLMTLKEKRWQTVGVTAMLLLATVGNLCWLCGGKRR